MRANILGLLLIAACASTSASDVARQHLMAGDKYFDKRDYATALEYYNDAVRADPRDAEAYLARGNAHLKIARDPEGEGTAREHETKALANYVECIRINPTIPEAYFNRAMIWAKRANYKQAAEDLLHYAKVRDKDPEPHLLLGQLYEEKFEDGALLIRAMEHYEKFLALGGRNDVIQEKVQVWKQLQAAAGQQPAAGVPPREKAPTPEEEKKAEELNEEWKRLIGSQQRDAALGVVRELLEKFPHTEFVKKRRTSLEAILRTMSAPKAPDKP